MLRRVVLCPVKHRSVRFSECIPSTYCVPCSIPDNKDSSRYNEDQDTAFLSLRNVCYSHVSI